MWGNYMIALNELLDNFDKYQTAYLLIGEKANLKTFVRLENKLKNAGLKFENTRALCNKKCGELIKLQANNQDTKAELKEILLLDKKALNYQKKFNKINSKINAKLKRLKNLPDNDNLMNLQVETLNITSTLYDLNQFLKANFKCNTVSNLTTENFIKGESEKLIEENNLPCVNFCKNGIVLLCTCENTQTILNNLLEYFKSHSISLIEHSIKYLKKSSAQEFLIHLNKNLYVELELKKEYFSRDYKIKYRDSKTDMTKFVNQINIMY